MGIKLISGAAAPLTAADLRAHCSIDSSDTSFDGLLTNYIDAASSLIEEITGRAFGAQTWLLALDAFPAEIELPRGPVTGVNLVKYWNAAGSEVTLDSSQYLQDLISDPQRIVLAPNCQWPVTQARANAVTVQFATGYATMPPTILQCIRATVAAWFHSREAIALPPGVIDALGPWRSQWVFA
jgi:uncharacterized phiE125 gp8 family phage protein